MATRSIVSNVLWNWASNVLNILTGFLVLRFVLGRLGPELFGAWVLVGSILLYFGLLNLGFDSSVVRFVSRHLAQGERREAADILKASQVLFAGLAALLLLLGLATAGAFLYSERIFGLFSLPSSLRQQFPLVLATLSAGVAVDFLARPHVGALRALDRWDRVNQIAIVVLSVRTAAIVLMMDDSIVRLGTIFALSNALSALLMVLAARSLLPEMGWRGGGFNHRAGGRIGRYGVIVLLNQLADLVRYQTDAFVISHFLRLELLAYFNFAFKLIDYMRRFIGNIGWTLFPVFSRFEGLEDRDAMRLTYLRASRITAFLTVLAAGNLLGSGRLFLSLWVGDEIGDENVRLAYRVLLILLLPFTVELIQSTGASLLYGLGRHRYLVALHSAEGAANLALSLILAPLLGIQGAALGTALPMLISKLWFLPRYVCRWTGASWSAILLRVVWTPILIGSSLGGMQLLAYRFLALPAAIELLLVAGLSTAAVGALGYFGYFSAEERAQFRQALQRRRMQAA